MANIKNVAVVIAAVILVTAVTISFSSYVGEVEQMQQNRNVAPEKIMGAPVLGSETADITIIEVGDYQCHMCKLWFEKTRPDIIENYIDTGKANLIFIDMPFLGRDSTKASEATYCANDQGKYWEYHSKLFEYQQEIDDGWAKIERLSAIAFSLNLDMEEFNACLQDNHYYPQINLNKAKAVTDFGAKSTPTFVIINTSGDTQKIIGAQPYSSFEEVINSML